MMYSDRMHAGQVMAGMLEREKADIDIVVSLMRGAVPISVIIAERMNAKLLLLPVRKIGPVENEEFAIACLTENIIENNPNVLITAKDSVIVETLGSKVLDERKKINRMKEYIISHIGDNANSLFDYSVMNMKKVLLVDDGIATGTSMLCALSECRSHGPMQVSIATPVSSKESLEMFAERDINVYCPFVPQEFMAVGQFYERFSQVSEDQIISVVRSFMERRKGNTNKV
ncbi:MAG: phosphoribosyltransferase [Candidatus Woesearchaeota archaeon]